MKLLITVDNREPQKIIDQWKKYEPLMNKRGCYYELAQLPTGDFLTDKICVERKKWADYIASMYDGRLDDQLTRMEADQQHVHFLLIEGDYPVLERTITKINQRRSKPLLLEEVIGSVASCAVRYPSVHIIPFIPTPSLLVYFVWKIAEKVAEGKLYKSRRQRVNRRSFSDRLAVFLDITRPAAISLLEHYQTLDVMLYGDESDFQQLPHIGPVQARKIWIGLHGNDS